MYPIHFYKDRNGHEPVRDRILFAAWLDDGFILLHYFVKKTQKTPRRELMKAQKALDDIRKRGL